MYQRKQAINNTEGKENLTKAAAAEIPKDNTLRAAEGWRSEAAAFREE